jgi:hypothetical protein
MATEDDMPMTSRVLAGATLVALTMAPSSVRTQAVQTLTGFASLPADSFSSGPTSGQFIGPANGVTPPFPGRQPIQGFSSILRASNGDFWAMSDNGFGSKPTSPDFVLRVYRISPDFKTRNGGSGSIVVRSHIALRDPDRLVNFPIVADGTTYPGSATPVDPAIKSQRLLTGGDFDIESLREAHDGTLWFGDEFGPFLLHTDASGKVLEAPVLLPGVQSPDNPLGGAPNLGGSRGFEGMAISPDGKVLYPMLEGPVQGDDPRTLRIHEFNLATTSYTSRRWLYRLEVAGYSMGDFTAVNAQFFLVIERDQAQGAAAQFKKIFLVDLSAVDASGFLVKHEVVDLLNLADPDRLGGPGPAFRFPFQTIESVIPLSQNQLGVLNDNNYPFSAGRNPPNPDPNEFILIRLDRPLQQFAKAK